MRHGASAWVEFPSILALLCAAVAACNVPTVSVDEDSGSSDDGTSDGGEPPISIAAAGRQTCALRGDLFRCWGSGIGMGYGADITVGDDETPASVALPLMPGGRIDWMAPGGGTMCAVWQGGDARCWGDNRNGGLGYGHADDLGDDETLEGLPRLPFDRPVVKIATTGDHACALLQDGVARCWGENGSGELGYGHTQDMGDDEDVSVLPDVELGGRALGVAVAGLVSCALMDDGGVRCWGENENGVLGSPWEDVGDDELPVDVPPLDLGGRHAIQVVVGGLGDELVSDNWVHVCVLLDDGAVRCWGHNTSGELGYGHTNTLEGPPAVLDDVELGGPIVSLAASSRNTCALRADGDVLCWGAGWFGYLGQPLPAGCLDPDLGDSDCEHDPRCCIGDDESPASAGAVDVGGTVVQLAVGAFHVCVVLDTGAVRCWGRGTSGVLGYGNTQTIGDDETPASAGDVAVF